jgi:hypothetical protein
VAKHHETFVFTDNLNVQPQLIGLEGLLESFPQHTSAPRRVMQATHKSQFLVLKHGETNRILTGYEPYFADYDINQTVRDQDILIIQKIPKYIIGIGTNAISSNPRITVIYQGLKDGMINYFHLDAYTMGTDGYGYLNQWYNTHLLEQGQVIDKDVNFCSSYIKGANRYNIGVNANVIYMTLPETDQDAFIISESLARKMETVSINKLNINIKSSYIPLNLYGDDQNYKIFPDIGETINKNGVICAFRKPTDSTFIHDVLKENLKTIQYIHDSIYYVHKDASLIDIDFHINKLKNVESNNFVYAQILKYYEFKKLYWKKIIDIYNYCVSNRYKISPAFNTLVTYAIEMTLNKKQSQDGFNRTANVVYVSKKQPVEFINCIITYLYPRKVALGYKISDSSGAKGVVGAIWRDSDMPHDDAGFRADIIISPESVINRMNPSQLWEQTLNRYSEVVKREVINIYNNHTPESTKQAYNYALTYINKINPNYSKLINKVCSTLSKQEQLVKNIEKEGIYLVIPPFLNTIGKDLILDLYKTYDPQISPVTYNRRDDNGNVIKTIKTKDAMWIGSKYLFLLYKIPRCMASGLGYISHLKIPIKPSPYAKLKFPISQTPIRFGEDENRYFNMVCLDPYIPARLYGLHAFSPEAIQQVAHQLLTDPHPSIIDNIDISTEQVIQSNHVIGIFNHMLATIGINSQDTRCNGHDIITIPESQRFPALEEAFQQTVRSYRHRKNGSK